MLGVPIALRNAMGQCNGSPAGSLFQHPGRSSGSVQGIMMLQNPPLHGQQNPHERRIGSRAGHASRARVARRLHQWLLRPDPRRPYPVSPRGAPAWRPPRRGGQQRRIAVDPHAEEVAKPSTHTDESDVLGQSRATSPPDAEFASDSESAGLVSAPAPRSGPDYSGRTPLGSRKTVNPSCSRMSM